MTESQEYLMDGSPLLTAARLGKPRLVRLLVEGGAQVNERNQRGETPLLAACRALRGERCGTAMLRVIRFLLENHADPNLRDKTGRTALMYACMERAGVGVAAALVGAGADPSLEDYSGASALVYAINARHQDTLQVLLDACRARGSDIIIIATDLNCDGSEVTRRYLNVLPSPDVSPVSCMSPSDIELKTNSPNSEGENIFNFRGGGSGSPVSPRSERLHSEPWLAIRNLAHLSQTYEENLRGTVEEPESEDVGQLKKIHLTPKGMGSKITKWTNPLVQERRRNTLPDLQCQTFLQPPSLKLTLSSSDTHLPLAASAPTPASGMRFPSIRRTRSQLLAPPDCKTQNKKTTQDEFRTRLECRGGFLPPIPIPDFKRSDPTPIRHHSVQLEQAVDSEAAIFLS